ncbi:MAG: type IX secretion system plug protein domain-containing protein, partial [Bacteroidales bacterium]
MKHNSSKILNFKYLAIFLLCIQGFVMRAENLPFELRNKVYNDFVQTVLLYPLGEPLKEPIIRLNEADQLQLSFDILGDEAYVYNYTILHCTYDWKPSDLQKIEYINGYEEDQIRDYRFSMNTLTSYVHYDFSFPTDNLKPKLSGNYLLIVYGERPEADQMLFTCRFMVVESLASISASVPQYSR